MNKIIPEKLIIHTDGGSRGNPGPSAIGVVIKDEKGNIIKKYGEFLGEKANCFAFSTVPNKARQSAMLSEAKQPIDGQKTNNEAEYEAVIFALKKAKLLFGKDAAKKMQILVKMDSELVKKQLSGEYKIEEERLFPYFIKIWNLKIDFGKVEFQHIPREQNKEADKLVNETLDLQGNKQALF